MHGENNTELDGKFPKFDNNPQKNVHDLTNKELWS
jgi:hypothetical protein